MTAKINAPKVTLREIVARVTRMKPAPIYETFDQDCNGTTLSFTLKPGWKPKQVWLNGNGQRVGVGNDYIVTGPLFDKYTVTFSTTPNDTDWLSIYAEYQP
jgi:hypothetical protein